jgi:glycogen synthase
VTRRADMADSRRTTTRVLMTADAVGGVFTYALELTQALRPHGVEVALAVMGGRLSRDQRQALGSLPNVELFESDWKLEWMDEPWDDVRRAGDWLLQLESWVRPDCVHLNGYVHGALPWRSPRVLVVAHSCVLSWWRAVKRASAPAAWNRYHEEVARGLHAASQVVAPSRSMLHSICELYGAPKRCRVIPNAVASSLARARVDAGEKIPLVLGAGRIWDEAKNLGALSAAANMGLAWPVAIAGDDGGAKRAAAECTATSGADGRVQRLGQRSRAELLAWMAWASIYALPARYEPFGLSVLEAALSGCALVLGDIPSLRENWSGAARFVSPDDPVALRDALAGLIGDSTRRKHLAARANLRAQRFSAEAMGSAYMQIYSGAAAAPTTVAPALPALRKVQSCAS